MSSGSSSVTPQKARLQQREKQRKVRLALNLVNAALDKWKDAHQRGRSAAEALGNQLLTERYLSGLKLGVLETLPDLLAAASIKLLSRQHKQLNMLKRTMNELEEACNMLRDAALGLMESDDAQPREHLQLFEPVFACLTLPFIGTRLEQLADMHIKELDVKAAIVKGFEDTLEVDEKDEVIRKQIQVYLTAWILMTEVDEDEVKQNVAMITDDMRGF